MNIKSTIAILFLILIFGCSQPPTSTSSPITETPGLISTTPPKSDLLLLTPEVLPIFEFRGIAIVGPFDEADLIEILTLMEPVKSGQISGIVTPLLIQTQYYKGEISEVPTYLAEVFYGEVGGDVYSLEKINGVWEIVGDDYWIK